MFPQLDLSGITTQSVALRQSKVSLDACARPLDAASATFAEFVDSLPDILKAAASGRGRHARSARAKRAGSRGTRTTQRQRSGS